MRNCRYSPHGYSLSALLILFLTILLLPCCLLAQQVVTLRATPLPVRDGSANFIAHYDPSRTLRLAIVLRPPRMEDEERFLRELQDPNSPGFHQFLSEQEWNQRFAPSAADEQAVVFWLQSQGLRITQRFANRLLVDVEASAGTIEKAFQVTINTYQLGERTCFSNDRDPSIPAGLASVVGAVVGLNNIEVLHSFSGQPHHARQFFPDYSPGPTYELGPSSQGDGNAQVLADHMARIGSSFQPYSPTDIYASSAYDYLALQNLRHCCNPLHNPGSSPPEASIAIAIWDDFDDHDLNGFLATYPYLAHNVARYFIDGHPPCCDGEVTLDVEWTTATANSFGAASDTAKIHVYEGANNTFATLLDVVNHALSDGHARVLTMSWGATEVLGATVPQMQSFHSVFNQMIGQGWTLVASSGDGGATDACISSLNIPYPGSDPDITSAGGSTLIADGGTYTGEAGWTGGYYGCYSNDGGGGGGCSAYWSAPSYQGATACGTRSRSVPDIALNADWLTSPQNMYYQGSLFGSGGTSIVAPELAGFAAQENAYLLNIQSIVGSTCGPSYSARCAPMGSMNPYIYGEALNQPYAAHFPFYDINHGCNSNDITDMYHLTPFCSGVGFDQVTGWGSVNMLQLAWTVNTFLAGDFGSPIVNFSGPPTNQWYSSDQVLSWQISDTSLNGHIANGVAGFSASWDSDPGDVYTQLTPGTGNSFYSGPMNPNSSSGSKNLAPAGEGCHTLNLRAWDNAGQPTPNQTYGPLCYDNSMPLTTITLSGNMNGQYYQPQVQVTLIATDDLSGVASTHYRIDSGDWQLYTAPLIIAVPGPHVFTFYSTDIAGNDEQQEVANFWVISDQRSRLTVSKTGSGTGKVTSADGFINCGATCSFSYFQGLPVSLQPTPDPGSIYAGWAGCDSTNNYNCNVIVYNDTTVTVTFNHAVPLQFIPVNPCRVVDTRQVNGPFGGPPIEGGTHRDFVIPQGPCPGIPSNAAAYALNVTAVPHNRLNYLTVWPTGQTQPTVSTLNSYDGRVKAAAAIVPGGVNAAVSVFATDTSDVILDIDGYFVTPNASTLAYFALPNPCRVVDTRGPQGPLGGPYLSGGAERSFPILSSTCNVPSTAQAYAFNATVVPRGRLGYLTLWPSGQTRPTISTLNAPTGAVTANAAVVNPGTGGGISAFVTNDTDLILDINGYFAPVGSGGNPLSLYAMIPCRALDTRGGSGLFTGVLTTSMTTSPCQLTSSASAYVLSATVVPQHRLGYLTLWPAGQPQPLASTLNAYDGAVTSNLAIVLGGSGSVNAYASDSTQLILDISSYFGP